MDEKIEQKVRHLLKEVVDPNTGKDLVASKSVKKIEDVDDKLKILIDLDYPAKTQIPVVKNLVEAKLAENHIEADVEVRQNIIAHQVQRGVKVFDNVRNVIAVSSGKGGVGKSTVAANLALALQAEGAKVGLLDADIYGPSQPTMLGLKGGAVTKDGKTLEPLDGHGLQVASIGVLIDPDEPMIWRGPLAVSALQQLIKQTNWHDLDYLIVDMPPGTGDVPLTVFQSLPVNEIVMVTSPQDLVQLIVKKALHMAEQMKIPVKGIIENYSYFKCPDCGKEIRIFGKSHIDEEAAKLGIKVLGKMPIEPSFAEASDRGEFHTVKNPYLEIDFE